jgi:hypothetical protein
VLGFLGLVNRSKFLDWYLWLRQLSRLLPLRFRPLDREAAKLYHQERSQFKKLYDDAVRTGGEMVISLIRARGPSQKCPSTQLFFLGSNND